MRGKFGRPLVRRKFDSSLLDKPHNKTTACHHRHVQNSDDVKDVAVGRSRFASSDDEIDREEILESDEAGEFYGGDFASADSYINEDGDDDEKIVSRRHRIVNEGKELQDPLNPTKV